VTRFIDAHVHPPVSALFDGPLAPHMEGLRRYLGDELRPQDPEDVVEFYRSREARAVLLGWDSSAMIRSRALGNRDIADLVALAPDVFWGFGAVDPAAGAGAVAGVHQAARLGLRGLSFHPAAQQRSPAHHNARPIWESAAEHGLICLIHTGFTRLGAGTRGGGGIGLEPARPLFVDRVAAEHPALEVILAHTGSLWLDEAIAVVVHKTNVRLCLAGLSPKAMSPDLLELIRGPLRHRVHFGSDYPFGSPDAWLAEWDSLGFSAEINRAVLHDNILGLLEGTVAGP